MDEGNDFMELLELQGSLEMVTKTQLIDALREDGEPVSDRQLTSLVSDGLIPKSARIGSRSGAYPKLAIRQISFVKQWRGRGLSVQSVKELLPTWRYMVRAIREREVSLVEFEFIARSTVMTPEAWFAIPMVLMEGLPCPKCDDPPLSDIKFLLKDGTRTCVTDKDPASFGFVMWGMDEETSKVRHITSIRLALPSVYEKDSPSSIVLGVPNGVDLPDGDGGAHADQDKVSVTTGLVREDRIRGEEGANNDK